MSDGRQAGGRQFGIAWPIVTVALGILAALLVAELLLRGADRLDLVETWRDRRTALASAIWMRSEKRELIYQHRPGDVKDGVRMTEAHGILRPTDVPLGKASGVYRIAAIGDSVGAAIKLPYEQRVFTLLEETLGAGLGSPAEALNFCVNGYDTGQEAALLEDVAARFEPDAVILQYCVNDFYPTEYPTWWYLDPPASRLVDLVWHKLDRRFLRGYPPPGYWDTLYREDEEGWREVDAGFRRIARYCADRGIRPLLVIVPEVAHGGWTVGEARDRHARVAGLGRERGFDVLDLLPVFEAVDVESVRTDPWDTFHLNPAGHRMAADAIASHLLRSAAPGKPAQ